MEPIAEGLSWLKHLFPPPQTSGLRAVSAVAESPAPARRNTPADEAAAVFSEANIRLSERHLGLRFVPDDSLGRHLVQLVDETTGEVLRQIPSEEAVRIARALRGLLLDGQA